MNYRNAAMIFAATTLLTGCDPMARAEGKSPSRQHIENMARLTLPDPQPAPPVVLAVAEPTPEPLAPPMPVCVFDDRGFMICT